MLNIPLMSNNITKEDVGSLISFLENTDRFTQGPMVKKFEEEWCKWLGVKYSIFVNSGSSANFMTMAGIAEIYGKGEIIVPTLTWSSDISSIITAGHTPVFLDVELSNLSMVEDDILAHITPKTKAVFLTHILGFPGMSMRLKDELEERNILLVEDVCESHGVKIGDKKAGSIGNVSNFSFYYAHHMCTIEGGMICTSDERFYQFMRMFRSHGMLRESTDKDLKESVIKESSDLNPEFIFMVPGYNMRGTELNAVIGLNQLKRLDQNIEKRTKNFKLFLEHLSKDKFFTDFQIEGSSNYAFVIILRHNDENMFQNLITVLKEENVEYRRGTAGGGNMARQPFVKKRFPSLNPEEFKNTEKIHFYGLYVGNFPDLEEEKIIQLCEKINQI